MWYRSMMSSLWLCHRYRRSLYLLGRAARGRYLHWKYGLRNVHATAYIAPRCDVSRDLIAGPYSFVNSGCSICPGVRLGAYTMLASYVAIIGKDHNYDRVGIPIIFSGTAMYFDGTRRMTYRLDFDLSYLLASGLAGGQSSQRDLSSQVMFLPVRNFRRNASKIHR